MNEWINELYISIWKPKATNLNVLHPEDNRVEDKEMKRDEKKNSRD